MLAPASLHRIAVDSLDSSGTIKTKEGILDMRWYGEQYWKPYVPVAVRRAEAQEAAAAAAKKRGSPLSPVTITGRKIASSFWGEAWCKHLESYSDFSNRLPRGRSYVRNGSVLDLAIERGKVLALVSGSDVYRITISIKTLAPAAWNQIKQDSSQSIDSLMDLLQGRFDRGIMERLTHPKNGLFPQPSEITLKCSCPDYAAMCKHVAATLYGVAARLDSSPELLFTLRDVDHLELISHAVGAENLDRTLGSNAGDLAGSDLSEMFGIELDLGESRPKKATRIPRGAKSPVALKKPSTKKAAPKKTGTKKTATKNKKKVSPKKAAVEIAMQKTQRPRKTVRKVAARK